MNEKTAQLRDIFVDVADGETVTERQEASRGSLVEGSDPEGAVLAVVRRMRDRFDFESSMDDEALVRVVRGYYDGESDSALASALDVDRETVVTARWDLHLLRERETEPDFDLTRFRRALADDPTTVDLADRFEVAESTARKYRRVVAVQREISRVNGRYTDEFEELLTDAAIEADLTDDVKRDGLAEATEGMENDLSF